MRGKERVVLIRPHDDGLMLHTMYYEDEIRSFKEIDHGVDAPVKDSELALAQRLIADLTQKKFAPSKYHDHYRERVVEAAEQKLAGHEVAEPTPQERRGNVIDLMGALKASLEKRGVAFSGEDGKASAKSSKAEAEADAEQPPREERKAHAKRSRSRAAR
jgi:DNA end-binding protein Ku